MTQAVPLEIVWRNPNPPKRRQRLEQITQDSAKRHYLVQELISTFAGSFWATTSSLEILRGGLALSGILGTVRHFAGHPGRF